MFIKYNSYNSVPKHCLLVSCISCCGSHRCAGYQISRSPQGPGYPYGAPPSLCPPRACAAERYEGAATRWPHRAEVWQRDGTQ